MGKREATSPAARPPLLSLAFCATSIQSMADRARAGVRGVVALLAVALGTSAAGVAPPASAAGTRPAASVLHGSQPGAPAAGLPAPVSRRLSGSGQAPSPAHPCGTLSGRPRVDQVLVIWEENHSFSSIIGNAAAPEINKLADRCGMAVDYLAVTHPSLPNYMSMTSGLSYAGAPWDTDCSPGGACSTRAPSIFSELARNGKQWRSYAESMAANCSLVTSGTYAARHNPAVYYTSIRSKCLSWDQPMGTPDKGALHQALRAGPVAALTTVTPNVDDDMHNGTVGEADKWLAGWVPQIVASPSYRSGRLAVVIVWDEGFGSGNEPSSAPLIVMSAYTHPGTRATLPLDDYSVLRSVSELTGVRPLGQAAHARSFVRAFNL